MMIAHVVGGVALLVVVAGCDTSNAVQSPDPVEIERLERQMWDDWKNSRWDAMRGRMSADALLLGPDGIMNRDAGIGAMAKAACTADSVSLEGIRVTAVAPTVATISYRATVAGTCAGQPTPPGIHTSIWVRRDGNWVTTHHQNTVVP